MYYSPTFVDQMDVDYVSHHGIKGMKWGIRRYQNYDGTRTSKGKIRDRQTSKRRRGLTKSQKAALKTAGMVAGGVALGGAALYAQNKMMDNYNESFKKQYKNMHDYGERVKDFGDNFKQGSHESARDKAYEEQYQRQRQAKQAADEGSVKSKQYYESAGKKVYDNLVGKYGKTKARDVAKQDLDAAKKRVADAMKRAAEEERNGGRTAATMDEVRKAREARKAAQAIYEQFGDDTPKQATTNTSTSRPTRTTTRSRSSTQQRSKNKSQTKYLPAGS